MQKKALHGDLREWAYIPKDCGYASEFFYLFIGRLDCVYASDSFIYLLDIPLSCIQ